MLACDSIHRFVITKHLCIHNPDLDIDLIVNEEDEGKMQSRHCIVITCVICTLCDHISVNAIYRRSVLPVSGSAIKFHPHHTRGRRAFPPCMAHGRFIQC